MDLDEVDALLKNMSRHTHVVGEEEQEGNLKRQTNAIHHAREELQRRDDIIRTMQSRITQLEHHGKIIDSLKERITVLEAIEQEKLGVDRELGETAEDLILKKAHIEDLSSQLTAEKARADELEELTTSLRDEIKSTQDELTENRKRSVMLEKLAENLKAELDGSEAQLSAEIQKQIELTNKFERSSHDWTQVTMKHEQDIEKVQKTNEKLREDNVKLHADLNHARSETARWKRVAGELEQSLADTKDALTQENEGLSSDLNDVKGTLSTAKDDYFDLQEKSDQLYERMALVTQEMESLRVLGWPRGKIFRDHDDVSMQGGEGPEQDGVEDEDIGQHCADMRACARNLQRILDSCRDESFHKRAPLPPATPTVSASTPARHRNGTPAAGGPHSARGTGSKPTSMRGRGTPGSGLRNTYSAPPGTRQSARAHQTPRQSRSRGLGGFASVSTKESHTYTWDGSHHEEKSGDGAMLSSQPTGGGRVRESMRPAHGWSQSLSFPSFDAMLECLIESVTEAAKLREQLADARYRANVSDGACKDATELLDSFEAQLREQRRVLGTLELFAVNINYIVSTHEHRAAQQRASGIPEDLASSVGGIGSSETGMGSLTGAYAHASDDEYRELELRLGELMLLDTKKEKKGSRARLVGVPTDGGDENGMPHTLGALSHMRSLCGNVQKSISLMEAYRVDVMERAATERALKARVTELLGLVDRLKAEHEHQLKEQERQLRHKHDKASRAKVSAVEGEMVKVVEAMQLQQEKHREALDAAQRGAQMEIEAARETLQAEYTSKVNEMVIATAEMEIMKDESSSTMREWSLLLDKLVRYLCTLQAKYDDLVAQKKLLLAFSRGLDALRDDLLFLSLACVEMPHVSPDSFSSDLLADAPIEFSSAVMHKLHRMSNSGGYEKYGYPTATRANRRADGGKLGRKYTVPSLRVVAIYILAGLRFRRILGFIRSRVKNTLFMSYDGYAETVESALSTEGPSASGGGYSGGGYSGGSGDPSGSMETVLRFPVPSYAELCHLTPAQVASFVVRTKRGEGQVSSDLFGDLSGSPAEKVSGSGAGSASRGTAFGDFHGRGLLYSITASGYGAAAARTPGESLEAEDESEDEGEGEGEGEGGEGFRTPGKEGLRRGRRGMGPGAMPKPRFLSLSPYSPEVLRSASKLRGPAHAVPTPTPTQAQGQAQIPGPASSFSVLAGVGTGHVRRSRFLWNSVPGVTDFFCLSQTALIERALVYMASQLSSLREEDEALKGAVTAYESNKRNYDDVLDASMSTLEQQARTIKHMNQQNASRDKNILKIALGHRRMAAVVQASGQVTGNTVKDVSDMSPHVHVHTRGHSESHGQGRGLGLGEGQDDDDGAPLELSRGPQVPGKVASTGAQEPLLEGVLDGRTIRELEDAGRMAEAEDLGTWRRNTFGHMDDSM